MKQFLLGLSVSLAFIAGCVTATVAQSTVTPEAHAAPEGVQRWQYKCPNFETRMLKHFAEEYNAYGAEGWELVTSEIQCFKRPL